MFSLKRDEDILGLPSLIVGVHVDDICLYGC